MKKFKTNPKHKQKINPKYRIADNKSNSDHDKVYESQKENEDQKLTKAKPRANQRRKI